MSRAHSSCVEHAETSLSHLTSRFIGKLAHSRRNPHSVTIMGHHEEGECLYVLILTAKLLDTCLQFLTVSLAAKQSSQDEINILSEQGGYRWWTSSLLSEQLAFAPLRSPSCCRTCVGGQMVLLDWPILWIQDYQCK